MEKGRGGAASPCQCTMPPNQPRRSGLNSARHMLGASRPASRAQRAGSGRPAAQSCPWSSHPRAYPSRTGTECMPHLPSRSLLPIGTRPKRRSVLAQASGPCGSRGCCLPCQHCTRSCAAASQEDPISTKFGASSSLHQGAVAVANPAHPPYTDPPIEYCRGTRQSRCTCRICGCMVFRTFQ